MARYYETKYYSQPTAEELKKRADESTKKAKRKGVIDHPVLISGKKICTSWWGTAWCENLERYADYENRIERGKRYVRNGSVIDLQIEKGKVHARVQGSRKAPYKVEIKVSPLSEEKCEAILNRCGKLDDLETLLSGKFPEDMKELFFEKDGLFPSPAEISLSCSCPDYAIMCKHVAAVLYGVGARFDEDPMLFFELRGVEVSRFIDVSLKDHVDALLEHADNHTDRMMDDSKIDQVFGTI